MPNWEVKNGLSIRKLMIIIAGIAIMIPASDSTIKLFTNTYY